MSELGKGCRLLVGSNLVLSLYTEARYTITCTRPYPRPSQGCKATICMPVTTPDIKVANVRRLGGTVELVGETYQEAQGHALEVRTPL